jgi:putative transposase
VFWSLAIEDRRTGWLTSAFHLQLQLALLHTCSRYSLVCPAYVLMPDHAHFLWLGCSADSDQRIAMEFFQRETNPNLQSASWQRQPHDHVLRDTERVDSAFRGIAHYILQNPVRAGLTVQWQDYPFCGNSIPGYPRLFVQQEEYWERFWRVYQKLCGR